MDEKGFLLGCLKKCRRIVPVSALEAGRVRGILQDGSREFVTLLACISAAGKRMSPAIIFSSESGEIQESWVEDFPSCNTSKRTMFATSTNGWSSNKLALAWLKEFDKETNTSGRTRLLLLDGHASHCTEEFIEYAKEHHIYLAIFPPHATHFIQPADVGLFSPLALAYDLNLNNHISETQGLASITKSKFWMLFHPAWESAATEKNIKSAFEKTGIEPFQPSVVLKKLISGQDPRSNNDKGCPSRLPVEPRECRKFLRKIKDGEPTYEQLLEQRDLMGDVILNLSSKYDLMHHDNGRLREAYKKEAHRQKRRRALSLRGDQDPKHGTFYTPTRIERARHAMVEAEALEAARLVGIASKKRIQEEKRTREARELAERKRLRVEAAAKRAQEKAARAVQVAKRKEERLAKKLIPNQSKVSTNKEGVVEDCYIAYTEVVSDGCEEVGNQDVV